MPISERAIQIQNQIINETGLKDLSPPEKIMYLGNILRDLALRAISDLELEKKIRFNDVPDSLECLLKRIYDLNMGLYSSFPDIVIDRFVRAYHISDAEITVVKGQIYEIYNGHKLALCQGLIHTVYVFKNVLDSIKPYLDIHKKELPIDEIDILCMTGLFRKILDNFINEELDRKEMEAKAVDAGEIKQTIIDQLKIMKDGIKKLESDECEIYVPENVPEIRRIMIEMRRLRIEALEEYLQYNFDE